MMRVRLRNLTLCVVALMFAVALPVDGRGAGDEGAGQTVQVRVGREASVTAHRLKIRFVAVREDSRCPEGVQCIWAGNARVAVRLSHAGRRAANVELNTMKEPQEITYGNYTIKMTNLAPRPTQNRPPKARDYVATFVVSKKV
ncbi:MAG TPA: hypothetical protein VIQ24_23795 [Pyrinomonadaceae bacterium]